MSYCTREEKEAYKAGLRKGKIMGRELTDEEKMQVRLIEAIDQLTAEVKKANEIRELARAERDTHPMPKSFIKRAVIDLQIAIGRKVATGVLTMGDMSYLREMGLFDGNVWQ